MTVTVTADTKGPQGVVINTVIRFYNNEKTSSSPVKAAAAQIENANVWPRLPKSVQFQRLHLSNNTTDVTMLIKLHAELHE